MPLFLWGSAPAQRQKMSDLEVEVALTRRSNAGLLDGFGQRLKLLHAGLKDIVISGAGLKQGRRLGQFNRLRCDSAGYQLRFMRSAAAQGEVDEGEVDSGAHRVLVEGTAHRPVWNGQEKVGYNDRQVLAAAEAIGLAVAVNQRTQRFAHGMALLEIDHLTLIEEEGPGDVRVVDREADG